MPLATAKVSHDLPFVASCTFLFTELPLLQRPAAAAAAGFDAVEFWWPFATPTPADTELDAFADAIEDAGVRLVGLNLYGGDAQAGERGLLSLPGREAEFAAALDAAVELGGRLDVRGLTCLYGNRVDSALPQEQDELAVTQLLDAAQAASAIDANILIEPVSGAPRYPLRTADDVVAVLDGTAAAGDAGNVWMLADLYHLATNGDDLGVVVERYADRIGHVQIADAPGRHEPGTGELHLDAHLATLEAAGYRGAVALEYVPTADTAASLRWLPRERRSA
jgi:hydroxypyruvate isomerase